MREIGDRNILDEFCIKICKIIEKHCRYIIVSGFVAISSGRSRATEDIDMITEKIDSDKFRKLHHELIKEGFTCMQSDSADEIYNYLKDKLAVRYTLQNKPLPEMEIKFAKDELDELQLRTRTKISLTELDIWFSSIDMNIAFKEELLKSEKDMKDAEHLRKVYSGQISEENITQIKQMIRKLRLS